MHDEAVVVMEHLDTETKHVCRVCNTAVIPEQRVILTALYTTKRTELPPKYACICVAVSPVTHCSGVMQWLTCWRWEPEP